MDEEGARSGSLPKLGRGGGGADLISALPDYPILEVLERLGSDAAAARTSILSRRWRYLWARRLRRVVFTFPYEGDDLISTLPEDLLLQVLERLGSLPAAARTCILSRRWCGLWTRLPKVTVTFHDVPFGSLEATLRRAARPGVCNYFLDIRVPGQDDRVCPNGLSSLLRVAVGLLPAELRFTLPRNVKVTSYPDVELPCFPRATSIELCARDLRLVQRNTPARDLPSEWRSARGARLDHRVEVENRLRRRRTASTGLTGLFHSLERFSLSGCHLDMATFMARCPRLRVLRLNAIDLVGMDNITIHSASLDELAVEHRSRWTDLTRISIEAPVLRQLTMSFHVRGNLGVTILAPGLEKVSWQCLYTRFIYGLGLWGLSEVGLNSVERPRETDSAEGACLQSPSTNVLSLHMCAQESISLPNAELGFVAEIDKHMVTNFSALDLHLRTKGHVFGAIVLHLLGLHRIRTAIQNLKIVLLESEVKDTCPVNCLCDGLKDQRTQSISLANLEKVEIEGVKGEDHDFDFLKVILRCAPMLKRVTMRLSDGVTPSLDWCTKTDNIVKAYPVLECNIDLGPGSTNNSQSYAST